MFYLLPLIVLVLGFSAWFVTLPPIKEPCLLTYTRYLSTRYQTMKARTKHQGRTGFAHPPLPPKPTNLRCVFAQVAKLGAVAIKIQFTFCLL